MSQLDLFERQASEVLHSDCRWPTGYHCQNDVCNVVHSTGCYYRSHEWKIEAERLNQIEKIWKDKRNSFVR